MASTATLSTMTEEQLHALMSDLNADYTEARDCGGSNIRSLAASVRWVKVEMEKRGIGGYLSAEQTYRLYAEARSEVEAA